LTVSPTLFPVQVTLTQQATPDPEGEHWSATRPGSDPSETFAIREYLPGDPVRQIHWKLSQKLDTLMLRELGLPVAEETLLLLETSFPAAPEGDAMDKALTALLSVSQALAADGIPHQVGWKDRALGEPVVYGVRSQQEFADLKARILSAACAVDDESIGVCFQRWAPGSIYAHTAVFSPTPDTNVVSLCQGNRVTLLLPERLGAVAAPGGIHVASLAPERNYLEL
jgi:hypothetical protein